MNKRPKCDRCGRDMVMLVQGPVKKIVCEFCDLNILSLTKCKYCGIHFSSYLDKACKCRKIDNK